MQNLETERAPTAYEVSSSAPTMPFVAGRVALPADGEGASVDIQTFGIQDLLKFLVEPGPP